MQNKQADEKKNVFISVIAFIYKYIKKFLIGIENILSNTKKALILFGVLSLIINLILELSLRQSVPQVIKLIFGSPSVFFVGFLIIFATMTISFLFKKRFFVFLLTTVFWGVIATVNYVIMVVNQRATPFSSQDLRGLSSTFDMFFENNYLNPKDLIIIVTASLAILAFLVFTFLKCRKNDGFFGKAAYISIMAWAAMLSCVIVYTNTVIASEKFDNPPSMFKKHGYALCFLYNVIDEMDTPPGYTTTKHIQNRDEVNKQTKPVMAQPNEAENTTSTDLIDQVFNMVVDGYKEFPLYSYIGVSEEDAASVVDDISSKFDNFKNSRNGRLDASFKEKKPNIIFLQIESFYDVKNIEGYEFSEDPIPIYTLLKNSLPGGLLTVPSIGAGTANVEFEIMTGMNKANFGFGEYPYFTVLQNQTCESIAYNAKEYGYKTHVVHNHKGTFYDRNKVFPNLGFDTFTSLECMPGIIKNPRNWCKDEVLIEPIIKTIKSSESPDLIYTISVQPHGKYPDEALYNSILNGSKPKIEMTGNEDNPENPGIKYYVNQINEVDNFLGRLIIELAALREPTVLVFYGDHLPAFSVEKYWTLKKGDFFQTDYIIWNNCGLDFSDAKDLTTYQLASYIFSKVGIDSGDINALNRLYLGNEDDPKYQELLHEYAYASFYDKALKNPESQFRIKSYIPTTEVYGITSAVINKVSTVDGITFIMGNNFNTYSKIHINGVKINTAFMDRNLLMTSEPLNEGDVITVNQLGNNGVVLGISQNNIVFNSSMIIDELERETEISDIMSSLAKSTSHTSQPLDDATADFNDTNTDEIEPEELLANEIANS